MTYRILSTGDLEIAARGTWRLVPGCSCKGIFEFQDRLLELQEICSLQTDDTITLEHLFLSDSRFRYLVNRVLELNGIDPDWICPKDIGWLLFGYRDENGEPVESPLLAINKAPELRHPRTKKGGDEKTDLISLIAAIAAQPGVTLEEALRISESEPFRKVVQTMDDMAWNATSDSDKEKAIHKNTADDYRKKMGLE